MRANRILHQDKPLARGDLFIVARDAKTGRVVRRLQIKNTITQAGLAALIKLLSQRLTAEESPPDDPTNFRIRSLAVGTDATPPVRTNTALGAQVAIVTLTSANKTEFVSDPFELRITVRLDSVTPANNSTLCEAGLVLANGSLFSRQTHPGLFKSTALVFDYEWRISISA